MILSGVEFFIFGGSLLGYIQGDREPVSFGIENTLKNYEQIQHIMIGTSNIKIVPVLRNIGVYIDSNLTMKNQITNKVCNHHLRNIAFIRKYLNEDTLKMLIHNHVISRLDYCNSIYYKLPNILLKKFKTYRIGLPD